MGWGPEQADQQQPMPDAARAAPEAYASPGGSAVPAEPARRAWLRQATRHVTAGLALSFLAAGGLAGLPAGTAAQPAAAPARAKTLLILGDSISAEYGLPRDSGWVKQLGDRLAREFPGWRVVNASISGETTSGGRSRLPALLSQHQPAAVVIELGGNDGLRGLDPRATEENLEAMIKAAQAARARVLLVGMRLPPNYGRDFTTRFEAIFPRLATRYRTGLVKFFFEGFEQTDEYFQPDRIHPTVKAQAILLRNVWPAIKTLLQTP